jgi:hypothetical protein
MEESKKSPLKRPFRKKSVLMTLGVYAIMAGVIYFLNSVSPSGPCNPGMGIFLLLLMPIVSIVLLFVTGMSAIRGRKSQIIPAALHGFVLLAFACLLHFGG